jgi:hypothetical protein
MDLPVFISEILTDLLQSVFTKHDSVSVVLDFSSSFQKKKKVKRIVQQENENNGRGKEVIEVELPEVLLLPEDLVQTPGEMETRKFMDVKRWYCMSRPQYSKSCGITSLVSCWNYLFSGLGQGTLPVLSQEKALVMLGIEPPFHNIKFGGFTGNNTLIGWFSMLNLSFNIKGRARVFWKLHGKNRTEGVSSEEAFEKLTEGLRNPKKAYIYHCYNHYMCPVGYERSTLAPSEAYSPLARISQADQQNVLIIAEASKAYPIFHIRKWDEVALDIAQQDLGVQTRSGEVFVTGKKLGKNLHCIIEFESLE